MTRNDQFVTSARYPSANALRIAFCATLSPSGHHRFTRGTGVTRNNRARYTSSPPLEVVILAESDDSARFFKNVHFYALLLTFAQFCHSKPDYSGVCDGITHLFQDYSRIFWSQGAVFQAQSGHYWSFLPQTALSRFHPVLRQESDPRAEEAQPGLRTASRVSESVRR